MVIVGVILYLLVIAMALAFFCLPAWRERTLAGFGRRSAQAKLAAQAVAQRGAQGVGRGLRPLVWLPRVVGGQVWSSRWWWGPALALLLLAPAVALLLRQWHAYDGFDHTQSRQANAQIAALLEGEQLAPPPKLPPELFVTREVEQAHPLAASASRQWELLDADFRQRLLLAYKLMRERHGYEMVLIEGWRSPERQAQLQALGPQVTLAGPNQSYHQAGLAADSAFLRDNRIVIGEKDPWAARGYELFGDVAQSVGLTWGGSWKSLVDLGHVELPRPGALKKPA